MQRSGIHELCKFHMRLHHGGRIGASVQAHVQSHDGIVLHQRVVEGRRLDLSPGKTDDEDAPLECDALGGALVGVTPDRVEDHIRATSSGHLFDHCHEVLRRAVDDDVRPEPTCDIDLALAADHGNDPRTHRLAQLHCRTARSTSCGMHQERLAGYERRSTAQPEPRGLIRDVERGGSRIV